MFSLVEYNHYSLVSQHKTSSLQVVKEFIRIHVDVYIVSCDGM